MTAFAFEGGVSSDAGQGSVEITDEQYEAAIAGMLSGKLVTVEGGFALVDPPAQPTPEPDPEPDYVTAGQVIVERARRLSTGFDYDFGDARGVHHIGTTPDDMVGWDEVTKVANAMIATATPGTILITTDTAPVEVTPLEWQAVLVAAGIARQPIWQASFILQAMDPIPLDFASDTYWP